ncbi:hypothetical protein Tco_0704018 [Tanacetum coccineum]|uniref:Uncharacterized protein n=1 Tax=Tanacetum coccineum TaxID=301880 RepID=A0ABQ4Y1B1_9ASTR
MTPHQKLKEKKIGKEDKVDLNIKYLKYSLAEDSPASILQALRISSSIDEVFSTWMTFRGNTPDLGSFGEETDEIMDLHQDLPRSIVLRAWRRRRKHKATPS